MGMSVVGKEGHGENERSPYTGADGSINVKRLAKAAAYQLHVCVCVSLCMAGVEGWGGEDGKNDSKRERNEPIIIGEHLARENDVSFNVDRHVYTTTCQLHVHVYVSMGK